MARATTKTDLTTSATEKYAKLQELMASLTDTELSTPFDFSSEPKKKEAHWSRDKNLRDVLIHLYEWHQLLLNWVGSNTSGDAKPFIPEPYNWRTYGEMNVEFAKKHQSTSLEQAQELFVQSHQAVMALVETLSNEELFAKGAYTWTGSSPLGAYFVSATASHYDWAMKKLKAHRTNCKG